jgi:hypothetical protein
MDPRDPHVSIRFAPKQRRIGSQAIDRAGGTLDCGRRPVKFGRASERQCIRSILELRLQAHVSGAVERKNGNADDDDQHQRHIGKNDAVGVAPERSNRLGDLSSSRIASDGSDPHFRRIRIGAAAWGDTGHGTLQRGAERQTSTRRGRL